MKTIYLVKTYFNNGKVETNAAFNKIGKAEKMVSFLKKNEDMSTDIIDYFNIEEAEINDDSHIYCKDNVELLVL